MDVSESIVGALCAPDDPAACLDVKSHYYTPYSS
jgi:hypothetical protein